MQATCIPRCGAAACSRTAARRLPAPRRPAASDRPAQQLRCNVSAAAAGADQPFDSGLPSLEEADAALDEYFEDLPIWQRHPKPGTMARQLYLLYQLNQPLSSGVRPSVCVSLHGEWVSSSKLHWLAEVRCPRLKDDAGRVVWSGATFYVRSRGGAWLSSTGMLHVMCLVCRLGIVQSCGQTDPPLAGCTEVDGGAWCPHHGRV